MSTIKITKQEIEALKGIAGGADIYAYDLAGHLRAVEAKAPHLLSICEPMMFKGTGAEQMPYFGAILTDAGEAFLQRCKHKENVRWDGSVDIRSYLIFKEDGKNRALITLTDWLEGDQHIIEVQMAPEQAWSNGTEEHYLSRIVYPPTREGFKAAYRVARILSNAHPRLIAILDDEDVQDLQVAIAASLFGCVQLASGRKIPDRFYLTDREEVPA